MYIHTYRNIHTYMCVICVWVYVRMYVCMNTCYIQTYIHKVEHPSKVTFFWTCEQTSTLVSYQETSETQLRIFEPGDEVLVLLHTSIWGDWVCQWCSFVNGQENHPIDLPPQFLETVKRGSPCCSGNSGGRERWVARGVFNNNQVPIQFHLETFFHQRSEVAKMQAKFCTDPRGHHIKTPPGVVVCSQTCFFQNTKEKWLKLGKILERRVMVAQCGWKVHFCMDS